MPINNKSNLLKLLIFITILGIIVLSYTIIEQTGDKLQ